MVACVFGCVCFFTFVWLIDYMIVGLFFCSKKRCLCVSVCLCRCLRVCVFACSFVGVCLLVG